MDQRRGNRRNLLLVALPLALAATAVTACGSVTDDCGDGCPPGYVCFYGSCVPEGDAGDAVADVAPDIRPDDGSGVDTESDAPADEVDDEGGGDDDTDGDGAEEDDAGTDADGDADGDAAADADADADGDGEEHDGRDEDGGDGDAGCVPSPPEVCNGRDDDCDGTTDEGFACARGTSVSCMTDCGTIGTGTCHADCTMPTGPECAPPGEVCNGRDDDCDTACDELWACCAGQPVVCRTTCGSTGTATCTESCAVPAYCPPPPEVCGNGADDDCDTAVDEGCGGTRNDTCETALDVSRGGTFRGNTTGYANDVNPPRACVPSDSDPPNPGPDAFFYFDLAVASDVFLNTVGGDDALDTVLYLDTTCGGAALGCNDDINPPGGTFFLGKSAITARALPPGRYYVTLDGFADYSYGAYALNVYIAPTGIDGDRCGSPIRIDTGSTVVSGTTCPMSNEYSGSCGGIGPETVYWFVVPEGRTVTISTCNAATTADTVLYIRNDCTAAANVVCNDNDPLCTTGILGPSRVSASLAAGIYYVFVDSATADSARCGAFQLDISGI